MSQISDFISHLRFILGLVQIVQAVIGAAEIEPFLPREKDVAWFDVQMNKAFGMYVPQSLRHVQYQSTKLLRGHWIVGDVFRQSTTVAVFVLDNHVVVFSPSGIVSYYVLVFAFNNRNRLERAFLKR